MSQVHNILFIDDELQSSTSRYQLVISLNQDARFEVEAVHPVDIMDTIDRSKIEDKYSLVIVDYKLSGNENENGETFSQNGYSMTSVIKEKLPYTPVYLISQILNVDVGYGEHYDKMLSHIFLTRSEGRDSLANDCDDFVDLRNKTGEMRTLDSLAEYLSVPIESMNDFRKVLPKEFKSGLNIKKGEQALTEVQDSDQAHLRFAKWINTEFLAMSGPLIGEEELAVIFGIDTDYFSSIYQSYLDVSLREFVYQGPFSKSHSLKWWRQPIFSYLVDVLEPEQSTSPWKYMPVKLGLTDNQMARCYVCNEFFPECIAYEEDDTEFKNKYFAHWRCTTLSEDMIEIPGYEPIYIVDEL